MPKLCAVDGMLCLLSCMLCGNVARDFACDKRDNELALAANQRRPGVPMRTGLVALVAQVYLFGCTNSPGDINNRVYVCVCTCVRAFVSIEQWLVRFGLGAKLYECIASTHTATASC